MQALSKTSLADRAIDVLRDEIVAGRWALGARLPNESSLADMLKVSRGTVREAVRVLASQGFLETRQGSGTYVLSTTGDSGELSPARKAGLRDQFEARCALDVEGARLAALRHRPEDIQHLRALLALRGNYDGGDRQAFVARDLAFHKAIMMLSGNQALIAIYGFFSDAISQTIDATLRQDIPEPDMAAHAAIIDAIASGDPARADQAVRLFMAPVLSALKDMMTP